MVIITTGVGIERGFVSWERLGKGKSLWAGTGTGRREGSLLLLFLFSLSSSFSLLEFVVSAGEKKHESEGREE